MSRTSRRRGRIRALHADCGRESATVALFFSHAVSRISVPFSRTKIMTAKPTAVVSNSRARSKRRESLAERRSRVPANKIRAELRRRRRLAARGFLMRRSDERRNGVDVMSRSWKSVPGPYAGEPRTALAAASASVRRPARTADGRPRPETASVASRGTRAPSCEASGVARPPSSREPAAACRTDRKTRRAASDPRHGVHQQWRAQKCSKGEDVVNWINKNVSCFKLNRNNNK